MPIIQQNSRQNKVNAGYSLLFRRYYFNVKEVNADHADSSFLRR